MNQIDLRAAAVGVVVALAGYVVSFVMVAPVLATSLLALGDAGTAVVLTAVQLGLLVLAGAAVAARQRRRFGLDTRTAALRTALTAGASGSRSCSSWAPRPPPRPAARGSPRGSCSSTRPCGWAAPPSARSSWLPAAGGARSTSPALEDPRARGP